MSTLKKHIIKRFKILSLLTISMTLSMGLLVIRMKLTQSFFLIFLVWNLFLAAISYAISTFIISKPKISKPSLILSGSIWLLFLPNAPYIITDLLHLKISSNKLLWFDVLLITSFAYNGLMLFFLTLMDMQKLLLAHIKKSIVSYGFPLIFLLTGFGVYLGRFLRYNSWEILNKPIQLLNDSLNILLTPNLHREAWLFTFAFAAFLGIGFSLFSTFQKTDER
ncbi:Uncharacterized membrane protein [Bizionia echini]|uniref:Uncharacterized membrane protein n=1 Tax=Bizionia echini TaxID=649333 RepID=A0A1I5D5M1_9FLAO|nr:DUF1361 domain-containing protein [Bizionia echini]SFN94548.1 Uncharacterized membrane protein [Bizionia echini]